MSRRRRNTIEVFHTAETALGDRELTFYFDYRREELSGDDAPPVPSSMEFLEATDEDGDVVEVCAFDIDMAREKAEQQVRHDPEHCDDWSME